MRREIFVLPMIVTMTAPPSPAESRTLRPVRLLVSNLADMPQPFISRAEREVVRLYSRIGVTLIWVEQGLRSGTGDLTLSRERMLCRITILEDDARRLPDSQALGAAPLSLDEPRIASVYYSLVQRAARRHAVETAVVLGLDSTRGRAPAHTRIRTRTRRADEGCLGWS
jgi:hypothetical protein